VVFFRRKIQVHLIEVSDKSESSEAFVSLSESNLLVKRSAVLQTRSNFCTVASNESSWSTVKIALSDARASVKQEFTH